MSGTLASLFVFLAHLCAGNCLAAETEKDYTFRFAVMGCAHLGVCDTGGYNLAANTIKKQKPDFVLFLGGMVDAQGRRPPEELWRNFDKITSRLKVPVYDVPGGCELAPLSVPKEKQDLINKNFIDRYKKPYYSFEHKNNLFIGLDSDNLPGGRDARAAQNQLEFLKKSLENYRRHENVFIFVHASPWTAGENGSWMKTIHPLIKGKVKFVFGAATHFLDLKRIDNVSYITSGTPPCLPKHSTRLSFANALIVDVGGARKNVSVLVKPFKSVPIEKLLIATDPDRASQFTALIPKQVRLYELNSPERSAALQPERVVAAMNIKPGMSILDIGAGTGFFTFPLADALKGTGRVYAADIDSDMLEYIGAQISSGAYRNVSPVLVGPEGSDPFYKKHSFDIIFMSGVYDNLPDPGKYFQELRPSLAEGNGRLYIVHARNTSNFSEIEFADFRQVLSTLAFRGDKFPIYKRLSPANKKFVKSWRGTDIPSDVKKALILDFNAMLSDRWLSEETTQYYGDRRDIGHPVILERFINPLDTRLAGWLTVSLDEAGVFDRKKSSVDAQHLPQLYKLNRIIITGIFKSNTLYWITTRRICVEKSSVMATLKSSGYELVQEHDFLTHHYFLEFKRKL